MKNQTRLIFLPVLIIFFLCQDVDSKEIPVESLFPKAAPEGWALIEGPKVYNKKTLFEHINGQAELFLKYGFQKSAFAVYQNKKDSKDQIEMDIYDMGDVLHAFGIFSRFRNENRPAGIGLDSYLEDRSLLFCKGKYFVLFYATESNPSLLKEWATAISSRIADPSSPPKEIGYFPKDGLKPGSIQYFSEGLLGYQFLERGFQGAYQEKGEVKAKAKAKVEGKEFYLFLAIFKNSEEAMHSSKVYRDDLSKKGKVYSEIPTQFGSNSWKGEDPHQGKVIVVPKGFYLLGAVGFKNDKNGENLLSEFMKNIK